MALQTGEPATEGRPRADFHPCIWGDYFLKNMSDDEMMSTWINQTESLKEQVRTMLTTADDDKLQKLSLIDAVQRLGIAYHFGTEIEVAIQHIDDSLPVKNDDDGLLTVALQFRLLRQHGYDVSSDIFKKFKDGKGNFSENLIQDVQGILSLYEASYYSVHGEDILDEALAFTKTQLELITTQVDSLHTDHIRYALKWPIHKGFPRKESRHYFSIYEQDKAHNELVLKLAKLDFNIVQKLHQQDLSIVAKWWKDLDVKRNLPFARHRVTESFIWALSLFTEPQFSFGRRIFTKCSAMITVVDDIYDSYGTMEELELFTEVIDRWDIIMKEELPGYMKWCFQVLLSDFYGEIEAETSKEGRSFCMHYAKEAFKKQVKYYMMEARWFNKNYVPTLEEYTSVAKISIGFPYCITIALCGMGEIGSKEVFDWLFSEPKIVDLVTSLARLTDDIMSHEDEQKRGHVASSIECYMKQYGATKQEACDEVNKLMTNLWKDLNQELLKPSPVPKPIVARILNFLRATVAIYKDGEGFSKPDSSLKDIMSALLVHPVPL